MTKYLIGAVLGVGLTISGTAFAASVQGGAVIADLLGTNGSAYKVLKVTDGNVSCYVVNAQFPAISCVK